MIDPEIKKHLTYYLGCLTQLYLQYCETGDSPGRQNPISLESIEQRARNILMGDLVFRTIASWDNDDFYFRQDVPDAISKLKSKLNEI